MSCSHRQELTPGYSQSDLYLCSVSKCFHNAKLVEGLACERSVPYYFSLVLRFGTYKSYFYALKKEYSYAKDFISDPLRGQQP